MLTGGWVGDLGELLQRSLRYEVKIPAALALLEDARTDYVGDGIEDADALNSIISREMRKNRGWYRNTKVFFDRPEVKDGIGDLIDDARLTRDLVYGDTSLSSGVTDYALKVMESYSDMGKAWRTRKREMTRYARLLERSIEDGGSTRKDELELDLLLKVLDNGPAYARQIRESLIQTIARVWTAREQRMYESKVEQWVMNPQSVPPDRPDYAAAVQRLSTEGLMHLYP